MEFEDRGFGDVQGAVCLVHMADVALAARLAEYVTEHECQICDRGRSDSGEPFAVEFEQLMEFVVETIRHFYKDANEVLPWDNEVGEFVGPQAHVWDVVDDIASGAFDVDSSDRLMEQIVEAIGYDISWTPWNAAADLDDLEIAWDQFAKIAKYQTRLVVGLGAPTDPPARVARYLNSLLVFASDELDLVTALPVGTPLFRGRLCEDPDTIPRDAPGLGPAPRGEAAANRMSPAGVSYFYASGDPQTAIAEIAGHGVEPLAVIGKFTTTRELRVLDFTGQPRRFSPFDVERREDARMARFLKSFVANVTVPVIPDGRQHVEYAPTQILTEFLRWVLEPKLDGIALPSSQTGDKTYVLFFGQDHCWTVGTEEPVRSTDLFAFDVEPADDPCLQLDPEDVKTYRVERKYQGVEVGSPHRSTPPQRAPSEDARTDLAPLTPTE